MFSFLASCLAQSPCIGEITIYEQPLITIFEVVRERNVYSNLRCRERNFKTPITLVRVTASSTNFDRIVRSVRQTSQIIWISVDCNGVSLITIQADFPSRFSSTSDPSQSSRSSSNIGNNKSCRLQARRNFLYEEVIHIGGRTELAFATKDDVAGSADAYWQLVSVPARRFFGRNEFSICLSVVAADECQLGCTFNLAISTCKYSDALLRIAGSASITIYIKNKLIIIIRQSHYRKNELGQSSITHIRQLELMSCICTISRCINFENGRT